MSHRIHRLDSLTIDKIAAGEVVDVPASCLKELIENSLDAGASDILVDIVLGGRELIRVSDDGYGMGGEDVRACIERHTTSKLSQISDLESLTSRGFRGEALASIVAISRVTITSAEAGEENRPLYPATTLVAEAGAILSVGEATRARGTTVEVASLFFNVPARRKFLKSPAKDTADIVKTVTCLALTAPGVSFRLIIDGHLMFAVPAEENLAERVRALLKEPFSQDGIELKHTQEGLCIEGLIVDPKSLRSNRSGQYLIVNGRVVSSLPVSYAVRAAYGTTCDERHHPLFVLNLMLDPSMIDVNVHPQKREIRFADEEWVRVVVTEAVSRALFGEGAIHSWHPPINDGTAQTEVTPPPSWDMPEVETVSLLDGLPERSAVIGSPRCLAVMEDVALIQPHMDLPCGIRRGALLALDLRQTLRAVVWKELEAPSLTTSTQMLLVPIPVDCSSHEASLLMMSLPVFESLGLTMRPFGPTSFLVESMPAYFNDLDVAQFVLKAIHDGVVRENERVRETQRGRLVSLYVATSKALRPPVSSDMALNIFMRWVHHGAPTLSVEGARCCSHLTSGALREWIAKGAIETTDVAFS
jgi:DNA mismatch repair protein MutL